MRHPLSTYRLQIRESFTLDQAAEVTDYLRDLGVSWAYLSPILEATPGSDHGYDVDDVTRVDPARGGSEGLDRFAAAARAESLAVVRRDTTRRRAPRPVAPPADTSAVHAVPPRTPPVPMGIPAPTAPAP